jgi:hypothetical protein
MGKGFENFDALIGQELSGLLMAACRRKVRRSYVQSLPYQPIMMRGHKDSLPSR